MISAIAEVRQTLIGPLFLSHVKLPVALSGGNKAN